VLDGYATLRADGEHVRVGRNGFFGARATVHIAHDVYCATIGDDVTVGRFGLVHACTVEEGVVVADGATVMDGSVVGPHALVAAGALVPPRKHLPGGFVYAGNPAGPVREIARDELDDIARAIRAGASTPLGTWDALPPLDNAQFVDKSTNSPLHPFDGLRPAVARAFVAPTALLVGDVRIGDDATVFYGCVLAAGGARIVVGAGSNVQDNTLIVTDRVRGDVA
jgi:carbonic anhydrase/acetyltransferase-like protein (isoleucine patch superfamily)